MANPRRLVVTFAPMRIPFAVALLALCSASVALAGTSSTSGKTPSTTKTTAPMAKASATKIPNRPPVVPFIEDDFTKAVAEARARKVPLFVEAWAPW
jgi:hypothetical protein